MDTASKINDLQHPHASRATRPAGRWARNAIRSSRPTSDSRSRRFGRRPSTTGTPALQHPVRMS